MTDLADFLLARIAEDEAIARAATPGPWHWDAEFDNSPKPTYNPDETDKGLALVNDAGTEVVGAYNYHCCDFRMDPNVGDGDQAHIARWDPARVLAECDAKRRIVEEHRPTVEIVEWFDATDGTGTAPVCPSCRPRNPTADWDPPVGQAGVRPEGFVASYTLAPCPTLRLLALPHADHLDYREEWKP